MSDELDERSGEAARRDPEDLLGELAVDWGLSWALIARLCGATATEVRRWRRGEPVDAESHRAIARIVAVLEMAREHGSRIDDPAAWLESAISEHTVLRPADLYAMGHEHLLFDLARGDRHPDEVLDSFYPDWRRTHGRSDRLEVIEASDGVPMIVER